MYASPMLGGRSDCVVSRVAGIGGQWTVGAEVELRVRGKVCNAPCAVWISDMAWRAIVAISLGTRIACFGFVDAQASCMMRVG